MAKVKKSKKKNLKFRRQLRKTIGCLLMVSSILIAAIPVQPTEASGDAGVDTRTDHYVTAPALPADVKAGEPVYYTKDGVFRFGYVGSTGSTNKFAVIAGYDQRFLEGNMLTIPNQVDAYIQFTDAEGTDRGFVAAAKDGSPLYYKPVVKAVETYSVEGPLDFVLDADGNKVKNPDGSFKVESSVEERTREVTRAADEYRPCSSSEYDLWHNVPGVIAGEMEDVPLYYLDTADNTYKSIDLDINNKARIKNAQVRYISGKNASVNSTGKTHIWEVAGSADKDTGVFAGDRGGNIQSLTIGQDLLGIGDFAFYGCTNLTQINLKNGLTSIGNSAFERCSRMTEARIDLESNLTVIGDHAFANCSDLKSFSMPYNVRQIGDSAFENCSSMEQIHLIPEAAPDSSVQLSEIGYKAFENCTSLQYLALPKSYEGKNDKDAAVNNNFHLSTVKGCNSLQYITTPSKKLNFVTDTELQTDGTIKQGGPIDGTYNFSNFKIDMPESFYFEAPGYTDTTKNTKSPVHETANKNHIAFSYLEEKPNPGKYEIVEYAQDEAGELIKAIELVFAVNNSNQLTDFKIIGDKANVANITLPKVIGPQSVSEINAGSFSDNCYVKKITLPPSLHIINDNAFKGCHNLKHLVFDDTTAITVIGAGAFATQQVSMIPKHECGVDINTADPELSFSGAITDAQGSNTEPFKYAMKGTNFINSGTQKKTYITYYSGWPTNLTVKYNDITMQSELIAYPTKDELEKADLKAKYPYMTKEYAAAAKVALAKYEAWKKGGPRPTADEEAVAESTIYNMIIPKGITAIKTGIFSGVDTKNNVMKDAAGANLPANENVKSITLMSIDQVEPYTFSGLDNMTTFNMNGGSSIGNYAFNNSDLLENVEIGPSVIEMGIRPFKACDKLAKISFPNSENFAFSEGIIYGKQGGANTKIIECLETRGTKTGSTSLGPEEFATVTSIADEAFMNCDGLGEVDLSKSTVKIIPERCFADYEKDPDNETQAARDNRLGRVVLPSGTTQIKANAFLNSNVYTVIVPDTVTYIEANALSYTKGAPDTGWDGTQPPIYDDTDHSQVTFICNNDSPAATYADNYQYINTKVTDDLKARYSIFFFDAFDPKKPELIKEDKVMHGDDAVLPEPPVHEGYSFDQWYPADAYKAVSRDNIEMSALYKKNEVVVVTHTVEFVDWNDATLITRIVEDGKDAEPPAEPKREGYLFTGWRPVYTNIKMSQKIFAQYVVADESKFIVSFLNEDGSVISRQQVKPGEDAIEPAAPTKEGFTFGGWLPKDGWKAVKKDVDIYATFTAGGGGTGATTATVTFVNDDGTVLKTQTVNVGEDAVPPADPTKAGYTFSGWSPQDGWKKVTKDVEIRAQYKQNGGGTDNPGGGSNNGSNSGSNSGSNNGSSSSSGNSVSGNSAKYKVVVNGGSGSGDYTPGTIVNINAYATSDGQIFDKWTSSSFGVGFVNQGAISTTFTMPSNNVDITATFKSKDSVSSNTRNTQRNATSNVDITKSGISNKDLAAANVSGSSDNYIVKITEDAEAAAAVIAALEAKYGDLTNIAYLPMDISLYESTGQTKITNVDGITVDITLPLPDQLIQYAGNNKAASVVNGQLEDLNTKFTTIDGVPCVQFTAKHFSPYVLYVDKANLTAGTIDATPKTGDPIHPKWFLAIGLACISVILFCKKDKMRTQTKTA